MERKSTIYTVVLSIVLFIVSFQFKNLLFSNTNSPDINTDSLKTAMIKIINTERADNNVPPVKYDSVAGMSAQYHADEMKNFNFFSHYSVDGIPPYVRYSFKNGGRDIMGENISIGINYELFKFTKTGNSSKMNFKEALIKLNRIMYNEKPPHDGHRKTILNKDYNGIGIGIAYNDTLLFYVETFIGHYIKILSHIPDTIPAGKTIHLYAQIINSNFYLNHIKVYYDSIPDSLPIGNSFFYDSRDSYNFPNDTTFYVNTNFCIVGLHNYYNNIKIDWNQFFCDIYTDKPGYYTIVPVLSDKKRMFEGAYITVFAK